jgi:hypothetical protein
VFATPGTIGTTAQDGLFNSQHVAIAYKFDGNTQTWVLVTASTTLAPLEALMLQANQSTNLTLIYNPANSGAPNRVLGKGWNLVGVAVPPETTSQPVDQALLSVYQTASGEWGYETVVSPGGLNQPAFLWTRGQPAPPMLRWRGYWVLMANADTLEGSSTTPLP